MYLGIDTHTRYAQVTVVDGDGNLQDEFRLPNDRLDELAEEYVDSDAAIEALTPLDPTSAYDAIDASLLDIEPEYNGW